MAASVAASLSLVAGTLAYAAVGGASMFGFGGASDGPLSQAQLVKRIETIDQVVVVSSVDPQAAARAAGGTSTTAPAAQSTLPNGVPLIILTVPKPGATAPPPAITLPTSPTVAPAVATTTVPQATTPPPATTSPPTTAPRAVTTTTRPPGVPADWPADEPIPPMPPDCEQPQLEDDGQWNCDH